MISTNIALFSQTYISGGIFSNTTFTLANSPYIVTGNLVLFPNVQLTIEPGVEMKFDLGKYFEVRGEIISIGTSTLSIVFTSNDSSPDKGDWGGIQIKNSLGAKASFEYCEFKYADSSNSSQCCFGGGPIYYENSKFENNNYGITGYTGYDIVLDNCEFINNTYGVTNADKVIINSTFSNNDYGLYQTERIDVDNSTFINNGTALWGGRGLLQNSIITNNSIGVNSYFEGFEIRNNTISNNDVGIKTYNYSGFVPIIRDNEICDNTTYNVENLDDINKNLTNNCWCLEDQNLIEDKLKDGYDDVNLGLFNYSIYDEMCDQITSQVIKDPTLPIRWSKPTKAKIIGNNSEITFSTALEINSSHFDIEHSLDGIEFQILGEVKGVGNSVVEVDYEFIHMNPIIGMNYYRVKQVDLDGKYSFSNIAEVVFNIEGVSIYPKPVSETLTIYVTKSDNLFLYNHFGQQILIHSLIEGNNTLDVSGLVSGIYFLKFGRGETKSIIKL